jgi:hypothetical protein
MVHRIAGAVPQRTLPRTGDGPKRRVQQPPHGSPYPTYDEIRARAAARRASMTSPTSFRREDTPTTTHSAEAARARMVQHSRARSGDEVPRSDADPKAVRSAADARDVMMQKEP